MWCNPDGANPRAAAPMRDAECFVQIQMAHVSTNVTGTAEANLSVHVGTVHVDLTAMGVNDVADFANGCFKNSMGRRVSDHQSCEIILVDLSFHPQISQIDVTVF